VSPALPFSAIGRFAGAHPVAATLGVGTVTHGAFVTVMLAVEWPEGDPGKLRQAAEILDELAKKIDAAHVAADDAAVRVWLHNSGPGVDAFKKMWQGTPSRSTRPDLAPPQGFSGYPPQVAAYCRRVAQACRAYAGCLDTIRHVLIVLAVQAWVNMLFTSMYGWGTAGVAGMVQKQIMERFFTRLAQSQLKIFRVSVEKIVFSCFYYALDSVAYAGIQQAMQVGIFAATGVRKDPNGTDVLSLHTNAIQFTQAFVANAAFDAVWDLSKTLKYAPSNSRWGDFLSRLSGSAVYGIVDNFEKDPTSNPVPTDWQNWATRLLIHGVRAVKPS
jgi:hypothetical protein